jgi:hypothetical protein
VICVEISSVALAVCVAKLFTSEATTAKPLADKRYHPLTRSHLSTT